MKDEEKESPQTGSGSPSVTVEAVAVTVCRSGARGLQRLSTILENEGERVSAGPELPGDGQQATDSVNSSSSCTLHSTTFSSDTFQPTMGDECAAVVLTCLFCQLPEFLRAMRGMCEGAVHRCFPSLKLLCALSEPTHDLDCCSCKLDLDCSILGSCHEATEFLELALEISEVCHR